MAVAGFCVYAIRPAMAGELMALEAVVSAATDYHDS